MIYYMVTGKNSSGVLINAGQQLTRMEALRLYTAENGWFLHEEDKLGTIEPGKLGDLVVLSDDYFDAAKVPDEGDQEAEVGADRRRRQGRPRRTQVEVRGWKNADHAAIAMPKTPRELTELLRRYDADVQSVAIALRTVVLAEIGPCHETVFQVYKNNVISILYSTTEKRMKDNICLVVVYRGHVNLMFPRGVDLKDPKGLLDGPDKAIRHVKMLSVDDVGRPGVRALVALAAQRPDLGRPARPLRKVMTILKAKSAAAVTRPRAPRLF